MALTPLSQVGAATAISMALGVVPGRAIVLAVRSLFGGGKQISQRTADVENLRRKLFETQSSNREAFIVVRGPDGAGKTCAIDTAARHRLGVARAITVYPSMSPDIIIELACRQVTRVNISGFSKESARRVAFWHRIFFRRPPVVVIRVQEILHGNKLVELGQTAQVLSGLGLRVCIDCSNNAYTDPLTMREEFCDIGWMSDEIIKQIPEYGYISGQIKNPETLQVFLAVCGGSPLLLLKLHDQVIFFIQTRNCVIY